jgi:dTDP-4-amino-4,6-dideoxygalactose transaminase
MIRYFHIQNNWFKVLWATMRVLWQGQFIRGKYVNKFEKTLAQYVGVRYAVGAGNGHDAIMIIFKALIIMGKLNKGDSVAVPSNTYIATIYAIINAGLKPVMVEPDATHNINISKIHNVKAVCIVHLYGLPCWGNLKDLIVVEDAAQAFGGYYAGRRVGSLGIAAAHSFYPTKNLGCLGDGGAITTNDEKLAEICSMLGNYGSKVKGHNPIVGVNSRLDELQASILLTKIKAVDAMIEKRRKIAKIYLTIKHPYVKLPLHNDSHTWHVFPILSKYRNDLQAYLLECGVETVIHYPIAPSNQFPILDRQPKAEIIAAQELSLPINITTKQALYIKTVIEQWDTIR